MTKEILFYAPIGKGTPVERIGGAEAGCLKTMAIYENAGIKVSHINRPVSKGGLVRYLFGMCMAPVKLACLALIKPKSVVHIVGFYRRTVWQELVMMKIAKFLGHKVIYEPRNGAMVITYNEGTPSYRSKLAKLLSEPDIVLCQGLEYVDMIRKEFGKERSYYPNYIMDKFIKPLTADRANGLKLVYFGRVVPEKNVDVCIKTLALLKDKGYDATLDIIGGYNDAYKSVLDKVANDCGVDGSITFYGRKPFDFIADKLQQSHYYLFPSAEQNEGHSNSLTEAMGCGVVPIVSTAGFNVSICGQDELVAHEITPEAFANIVDCIEKEDRWQKFSKKCYDRVMSNYTQSIVSKKLISYVEPLFTR